MSKASEKLFKYEEAEMSYTKVATDLATGWQELNLLDSKQWTYLTESNAAKAIVTQKIAKDIKEFKG